MNSSRVLEVQGLLAGYAGVPVIRDLDLHVDAGEIVALLGPNGAGKTTTLLTVAGVLEPLGGSVTVLGASGHTPANRLARRGLAYVPEDRSLFSGLSVGENLWLGSRRRRVAEEVLEYFPALEPLLGRRAGLLSGGEQQMLALARALATRPKLLLVDEMSLGLAPVVVESLLPVLRRIVAERNVGILLVEQHVRLALQVADRACVLAHGRVHLQGTSEELRRNRSLLEAGYLG
ncbi:MAG TPA: ABC transporter ATP-binding protein [Acidimicrobiales bacterium]|nr:ABC transporter ATP-binding protein [Acidimicrobiales bacterium]